MTKWRDVCEQYYFHQEASAKRVLDYFESSKLDQIMCADVSCSSVHRWCILNLSHTLPT